MSFANFSRASLAVLEIASRESQQMNHYYIGTEHIFMALCRVEQEAMQRAWQNAGFDAAYWLGQVRSLLGKGPDPVWGREIRHTPRSQKVYKIAGRIARQDPSGKVEPIHLMLALLLEGEGIPMRHMKQMGFSVDALRDLLLAELTNASSPSQLLPGGQTPALNQFGRDLTQQARKGKLSPLIGRQDELRKIVQVLMRRTKNNPLIVGEAGVGKSCLIYGLAQYFVSPEVLDPLKNRRIVELSMTALVAGTRYRGDFEERLQQVVAEAKAHPEVILFLDEIHTMVGAGSASGSMDAANILKPALANGEISCIGSTTLKEYRRYLERDASLERRFEVIQIGESTQDETIQILAGLRKSLEDHHQVTITDDVIAFAVKLAGRYLTDRRFPDKAIDLIDMACSQARLGTIHKAKEPQVEGRPNLTKADIARVVSQKMDEPIPENELSQEDFHRARTLEERLKKRVVGQDSAVAAVAQAIRKHAAGLHERSRPISVLLFAGPTGVGKTELARALASAWFGGEKKLLQFDMSEYMEPHSVSRLVGSPPGYIGHEEEGQLTRAVRTNPYSVLLLDEVEKAHPDVLKIFLQVFDAGRLTDAQGRTANFTNTVIILTSNLGTGVRRGTIGFAGKRDEGPESQMEARTLPKLKEEDPSAIRDAIQAAFSPELRNRIDDIIIFRPLTDNRVLRGILNNMLSSLKSYLQERQLNLDLGDEAADLIIRKGTSKEYGARELKRTLDRMLTERLTDGIIAGQYQPGDTVLVHAGADEKLTFRVQQKDRQYLT